MNNNIKSKAPIVAGTTAIMLAIFKFIVGITSGSLSVLSSAIDSMLDFLVSALNYFALKKSGARANDKFNYGYGKLEALMALFEGAFIVLIAAFIFYSSIDKILNPTDEMNLNAAIAVMLVSIIATGALILYLNKEAKRTNSLIIKADSLHYKTDFFTNFGIIVALVIIKVTGFHIIDSIFGIIISGYIAVSAIALIKEGVYVLLDGAIEDEIKDEIATIISNQTCIKSIHGLRTRRSAQNCFLTAHLVFDPQISLLNAHQAGDSVELLIAQKFPQYQWIIDFHFDPFDDSEKLV